MSNFKSGEIHSFYHMRDLLRFVAQLDDQGISYSSSIGAMSVTVEIL